MMFQCVDTNVKRLIVCSFKAKSSQPKLQYCYNYNFIFTFQIEETDERIDMEKLKVREQIHFYADILLFEDELGDNGHSMLSVKIVSFGRQEILFYYSKLLSDPFPQSHWPIQ